MRQSKKKHYKLNWDLFPFLTNEWITCLAFETKNTAIESRSDELSDVHTSS